MVPAALLTRRSKGGAFADAQSNGSSLIVARRFSRTGPQGENGCNPLFYIIQSDEPPNGWVALSTSAQWVPWLRANIPDTLAAPVRAKLISNLKHILVGLELKAALIQPHHEGDGVLFEPYFQGLISEFCVGVFSLLEGLGAAHWLGQNGLDGAEGPRVGRQDWQQALCRAFDPEAALGLPQFTETIGSARDRLHQDRLGMREDIDWHAFTYEEAFVPAMSAVRVLLRSKGELAPDVSNLPEQG